MIAAFLAGSGAYAGRWERDEPDHDDEPRLADFGLALAISAALWTPVIWLVAEVWP